MTGLLVFHSRPGSEVNVAKVQAFLNEHGLAWGDVESYFNSKQYAAGVTTVMGCRVLIQVIHKNPVRSLTTDNQVVTRMTVYNGKSINGMILRQLMSDSETCRATFRREVTLMTQTLLMQVTV